MPITACIALFALPISVDNIDETFHFDLETRLAKVYYLYLANTNLCTPTWRRRKIDIERVFIHPAYLYTDQPELSADIAILKIPNAVHDLQPVCLPLNGTFDFPIKYF